MRSVPAYDNALKDAFERCLDLYLCPRVRKKRVSKTRSMRFAIVFFNTKIKTYHCFLGLAPDIGCVDVILFLNDYKNHSCFHNFMFQINIDPESLKPKLPSRKDLKPYPTTCYLEYRGHKDVVISISTEANGQWIASGRNNTGFGEYRGLNSFQS